MKELDLMKFFKIVWEHIIPVILVGVICAALTFGYFKFFVPPTYRTTTSILVNNGGLAEVGPTGNSVSGSDVSASLYLVNTCVDIIESDNMYKELASALDDKYSYSYLKNCFYAVSRDKQSLVIDILTYGSNPAEVKQIAGTFLEVAPTFISNNILNVDIKVLATAEKTVKVGPTSASNALIAFAIGAVLCGAFFVILHLKKNTIDSEKDFKEKYDLPFLGTVPTFEIKQTRGKLNGHTK